MILQSEIQSAINDFTRQAGTPFHLKGIFFDMDGVLFNSMPLHAKAWMQVFQENNFPLPEEEPYMNEGSTALYTVKKMYRKYRNEEVTEELAEKFRIRKHQLMDSYPDAGIMPGMKGLLEDISRSGISCWVVTGSAQSILIDRLEKEYQGSLFRDKMVTAHDVKIGKPHPEPYLKALEKSGLKNSEAIVIENAPMGVESAKAAGLFTIAVNTGPLNPAILKNAGAELVLSGCGELIETWPAIVKGLIQ